MSNMTANISKDHLHFLLDTGQFDLEYFMLMSRNASMTETVRGELDAPYRSEKLDNLSRAYMHVHGYLSLFVCLCGIPMNIINISVLSRRNMQTPVNFILTSIAVSDLLTMTSYVPFALHFYCQYPPDSISPEKNSFGWMTFLLFHVNFTATTHTIAIWLGVGLAIFRFKHIQSPAKGNLTRMRRLIRARIVVFVVYAGSILLLIPNYLSNELDTVGTNTTIYILKDPQLATPNVTGIMLANVILYSVFAKLIPCILMIAYGSLLLKTLNSKFRMKRQLLLRKRSYMQRPLDTSRTTIMLLIVLALFLLTELPQAVLILLSVLLRGFFENVYIPLGDAMDIVALLNNAINFLLYCSMSREFRKGLAKILGSWIKRRRHVSRRIVQTDYSRQLTLSTVVDSR